MREAIHNMTIQALRGYIKQLEHPITGPIKMLFGLKLEMGEFFQKMRENSTTIHRKINGYVQMRKRGQTTSNLADYDMLSVFLTDSTMFPDEWIVDTLLGFCFALTRMPNYVT